MEGELSSERSMLDEEENACELLKDRIISLEENYINQREKVSQLSFLSHSLSLADLCSFPQLSRLQSHYTLVYLNRLCQHLIQFLT